MAKAVKRPTFEQACRQYVHRFTMEHVPGWALNPLGGKYYAPQFATDREWYVNTKFPGEPDHLGFSDGCYTTGQGWPLGHWLEHPFRRGQPVALNPSPIDEFRKAGETLSWLAVQFRDRANDDGESTSIGDAEQVEAAKKAYGDLLEMLDNVSASLENVMVAYGTSMSEADWIARDRIASAARAVCDALLRGED